MSGIAVCVQPKHRAVHVLTDSLGYNSDGLVLDIRPKCFGIPGINMVVASLGAGSAAAIFAFELERRFRTFDHVIASAERVLPEIYNDRIDEFQGSEFSDVELHLAGWSNERDGPECYSMMLCEDGESFELVSQYGVYANPAPALADFEAASFAVPDAVAGGVADALIPEFHLLHMMEIQRRIRQPIRVGYAPRFFVGGAALLTTIRRDSITQRVLHKWRDTIGEHVEPECMDWQAWLSAHQQKTKRIGITSSIMGISK